MKVEFIKSPTGKFRLAYHLGDVADLEKELAQSIIDAGYGVPVAAENSDDLSKMKLSELRELMESKGFSHEGMKKTELIDYLKTNMK